MQADLSSGCRVDEALELVKELARCHGHMQVETVSADTARALPQICCAELGMADAGPVCAAVITPLRSEVHSERTGLWIYRKHSGMQAYNSHACAGGQPE